MGTERESTAEGRRAPPSDEERLQSALKKIERGRAGLTFEWAVADIDRFADDLRKVVRDRG
jgi:hypothetical protein